MKKNIYLGNFDAKRDWGHAKDYVEAMYLILQQDEPEDFVIATGVTTTVRDFLKLSFKEIGINILFKGIGIDEYGYVESIDYSIVDKLKIDNTLKVNDKIAFVDKRYFRPTEVDLLIGDSSKAKKKLGWKPKYNLHSLIKDMITFELSNY